MRELRFSKQLCCLLSGAVLLNLGGCLGPNPGFFVSTSAANATIMTLVSSFWNNILASLGS